MRRVLNNHGMEPRARLCRLSFSSPSRRTQAGIPREMFYSGTPRAPARAGTSCCPSIRRLNAPAQVAATAICIQSTLQFGPRKRKGAPTSPYIRNNVRTPIRRDITRDRSWIRSFRRTRAAPITVMVKITGFWGTPVVGEGNWLVRRKGCLLIASMREDRGRAARKIQCDRREILKD